MCPPSCYKSLISWEPDKTWEFVPQVKTLKCPLRGLIFCSFPHESWLNVVWCESGAKMQSKWNDVANDMSCPNKSKHKIRLKSRLGVLQKHWRKMGVTWDYLRNVCIFLEAKIITPKTFFCSSKQASFCGVFSSFSFKSFQNVSRKYYNVCSIYQGKGPVKEREQDGKKNFLDMDL